MKIQYILLLLIIFAISCSKDTTTNGSSDLIDDLLVKNNEISGWTYKDGNRWIANNITELTTYINGGAEIFQNYDFLEGSHQTYLGSTNNNPVELKLTVYNQTSAKNAEDCFKDSRLQLIGASQWNDGAGVEAEFVRNGGLSQELAFYGDKYYVKLEINYDTEESLEIIKLFALNVDSKINN